MALKVAVTGASGFVGRNTVAHLLKQGFDVTAVTVPEDETLFHETEMRCRSIEDLAVQSTEVVEDLTEIFTGNDTVIHLVYVSDSDLEIFENKNNVANQNVINAALDAGVKKFITNSGLGVTELGKRQETTNGYFRMKKNLENALAKAEERTGMRYVIFRPSYIIGRGDELTPTISQKIRNGDSIMIIGDGRYRMQPIAVRDVAQIYSTCLQLNDFDNQTFDLVGPLRISYTDYIKLIGRILERQPHLEYLSKQDAISRREELGLNEDEIDLLTCDVTSDERVLKETFNLQPTPLEDAVREIVHETTQLE